MVTCDILKETPKARLHRWALCLGLPLFMATGTLLILTFGGPILIAATLVPLFVVFILMSRRMKKKVALNSLYLAAYEGNKSAAVHLLKTHSFENSELLQIMLWACERGNTGIIILLLDHGASVDGRLRIPEIMDVTPLYIACLTANAEIASLLLSRGAKKDAECILYGSDGSEIWKATPSKVASEKGWQLPSNP